MEIKYNGLRIEPTLSASRELMQYSMDLYDVLGVLENGYDCSASRRKSSIIEKCLKKGDKEYKVVLAETQIKYPNGYVERVLRLIHFGRITFKKERRRKK